MGIHKAILCVLLALCSLGMVVVILTTFRGGSPAARDIERVAADTKKRAVGDSEIHSAGPAIWIPSVEQQAILDQAATAAPDPLSDELAQIIASLPEEERKLVFFGSSDPHVHFLKARSWALKEGVVQGRAEEVEIFLSVLNQPLSEQAPDQRLTRPTLKEIDSRHAALNALANALLGGAMHKVRFPTFERQALAHLKLPEFEPNAMMVLYYLDKQNGLSEEGRRIFEETAAGPRYRNTLDIWDRNARKCYSGK